jgi:hypothetical protein
MPILAKIAVSAANNADNTAHTCQEDHRLIAALRPAASPMVHRSHRS